MAPVLVPAGRHIPVSDPGRAPAARSSGATGRTPVHANDPARRGQRAVPPEGALPLSAHWSGVVNGTVSRTYDTDFRVKTESVNGSQIASYNYDADSLLTAVPTLFAPVA